MSHPVQLYVYDLSNGIARQLSLQLTGRQIDGVWHTSVVVFDKEIFYGQGIKITQPGKSHHGSPLRTIDMGETAIDEETFEDYLAAVRENYTADKYHLLDFNCNTFTNDCLGFLTGGSIPAYIKALPSDFLSTPFGQALRPTIDAMFSGQPVNNGIPPRSAPASTSRPSPSSAPGAGLLQPVATQATAGGSSPGTRLPLGVPAPVRPSPTTPALDAPPTAPMHITNPASFQSLLRSHRAVVAFFTSATCGPCRMIEPVFEELAKGNNRSTGGMGFAKIDLGVGLGGAVASEYQVRATPTFIFFLDGKKAHELRGANAPELKTQTDLLIHEAFPLHAHASLRLPTVEVISLDPIFFKQVPNLDTLFAKLSDFIDGVTGWTGVVTQARVKKMLYENALPFLKASTAVSPSQHLKSTDFDGWLELTSGLAENLAPSALFPLVDIWRLALLNATFAAWIATKEVSGGSIQRLIEKALKEVEIPRNYLLTLLRMLANAFSNEVLAREVILFAREGMTKLLVDALLHDDALVRTAAASLAFNIAAYLQKRRVDKVKARDDSMGAEENEEWEVEIVVAVLGGIERESSSEETVHRLAACLGLLLRLSPYTEQVTALLETLQARELLKRKLEKGGFGEGRVAKKEARKLILEVAEKLCPESA